MSVTIKITTSDGGEITIVHEPQTCTEEDIAAICLAVKRFLREEFGRSPMDRK